MNKMQSYASFDDFTRDQSQEHQKIIAVLRKFVKKTTPELKESVKWGNGCWVNGKLPVAFVHCENDHVQFGFFGGSFLKDTKNVLEGNGKYVRHIKLRSPNDINMNILAPLVKQAEKTDYKDNGGKTN